MGSRHRHLSRPVRFHVRTDMQRPAPRNSACASASFASATLIAFVSTWARARLSLARADMQRRAPVTVAPGAAPTATAATDKHWSCASASFANTTMVAFCPRGHASGVRLHMWICRDEGRLRRCPTSIGAARAPPSRARRSSRSCPRGHASGVRFTCGHAAASAGCGRVRRALELHERLLREHDDRRVRAHVGTRQVLACTCGYAVTRGPVAAVSDEHWSCASLSSRARSTTMVAFVAGRAPAWRARRW
jgi:hypothetical protein